jgi:prepilin peptidase CpaA
MPLQDILFSAGCGVFVLAIAFALFCLGWIGGGDAKLAAATALWFGFDHLLDYALYASLFGGALTLLILRFRVMRLPQRLQEQAWLARLHRGDSGVPYGIALAAAALVVYPETAWMGALTL